MKLLYFDLLFSGQCATIPHSSTEVLLTDTRFCTCKRPVLWYLMTVYTNHWTDFPVSTYKDKIQNDISMTLYCYVTSHCYCN